MAIVNKIKTRQLDDEVLNLIYLQGNSSLEGSGISFSYPIPSGNSSHWVPFPIILSGNPFVQSTIEMPASGTGLYIHNISGIATSGFYAVYSAPINQDNYNLHVRVSF